LDERSIDEYNEIGNTLLTLAVKQGDLEITKYAIDHGANVNKPDEDGETPLSSAIAHIDNDDYSGMQLLHLLLKKGADVNAQDNLGNTSLHYAVDFDVDGNNIEAIKLLLDTYHANPNIVSKDGSVALDMANNDVVRDFLSKRALNVLYQSWTDKPNKKSDIPGQCNNETVCPITYYELNA
jgi:ankyrin repeat protein